MAPANSEANGQQRRRVDGTVSMVNFAQRKGQTRAIKECKKRKEKKVFQTAKHLRRYRKAMKQEGYEAGTGASRKRVVEEPSSALSSSSSGKEETIPLAEAEKKMRRPKANPFAKAQEQAEAKKNQVAQNILEKETNEKDREQKLKLRRKQTKLLSKRSKRGQPIIKNMVDNLLIKLQKDQNP
jgi:hypothetical protein